MIRRIFLLATLLACMLCVACSSGSASSASSSDSSSSQASAASTSASASAASQSSDASGSSAQMANPWSESADAQQAAEGAGFESFVVPDQFGLGAGTLALQQCRFMSGLAEADATLTLPDADQACSRIVIRKGAAEAAEKGLTADGNADVEGAAPDISGDYTEYAHSWVQVVDNIEVVCFGDQEGQARKMIWCIDGIPFSIVIYPFEGEEALGFAIEDVALLVSNIK